MSCSSDTPRVCQTVRHDAVERPQCDSKPGDLQAVNALFDIVQVTGPDARSFLQGQLTQDVSRLDHHPSLPAAWCNPKGRVITVMRLIEPQAGIEETCLSVPSDLGDLLIERLLRFRFRARVDITRAGRAWGACAVSDDEDLKALEARGLLPPAGHGSAARNAGVVAIDTGAAPRVIEVYGPLSAMHEAGLELSQPLTAAAWRRALIDAGMPLVDAGTTEKYTPHMLNLDRLDAISFTKGCYTGQEVVARTEHLGKSRRRLLHFQTEEPFAVTGSRLRHEDREVGEVLNVAGRHLLAVVPAELVGLALSLDGRPAMPVDLPYEL